MKRAIAWALGGLVAGAVLSGVALAADYDVAGNCRVVGLDFIFDGQQQVPQVANGNPGGFICAGTTYVPLRFMAQALGKAVAWDGSSYTVTVSTPGTSPAGGTGAQAQTWTDQGITFSNLKATTDSFGFTKVQFEATNTTSTQHMFTYTVSFFDSSGNLLGTALGSEDGIGAGQTKTEQSMTSDHVAGYASATIQVDAMIQ